MTGKTLARIARMPGAELRWRTRAAIRTAGHRAIATVRPPKWDRRRLNDVLAPGPDLAEVRTALDAKGWLQAHHALSLHLRDLRPGFLLNSGMRDQVRDSVTGVFPSAAGEARRAADRILAGSYDLLGYTDLRFCGPGSPRRPADDSPLAPDWHCDPVHDARAPIAFWSTVPFLDPQCGDHKIIWELNRHQHWLRLGRAYWLTGDARYRAHAVMELGSWLRANPPLTGINWASMLELAFRSISWLWAMHFFADPHAGDREPWLVDLLVGLDAQLDHVEQNLSYYFSPNTHLLGEALALYVCGRTLPCLARSARREATGRSILVSQVARQIAPDGGHCERSTHYHRYTLDFYLFALAVARLTDDPARRDFEEAAMRLAIAARLLADDRGRLPLIGDDDGGLTFAFAGRLPSDVRDSLALASVLLDRPDLHLGEPAEEPFWMLGHPMWHAALGAIGAPRMPDAVASAALPETGYYVSRSSAGDHLVVDAGPHGFLNGGHAHADALAFTLTVRNVPLLIDPGTGCYSIDAGLRDRLRSTAAHNTVLVDDSPQSIPLGPFHWERTTDGTLRRWRTNAGFDYFEGTHGGYRPVEHRRHLFVSHGDIMVVADLVAGTGHHRSEVHWHIDPRWRISGTHRRLQLTTGAERVLLLLPHGSVTHFHGDDETGLGWHAPVYGRLEPASSIAVSHDGPLPAWLVSVFGFDSSNDVLEVETMPVWTEAGVLAHSLGLRISRSDSTDYLLLADPAPEGVVGKTWRLGELETDARMLFCRVGSDGQTARVGLVDGSVVRVSGGRRVLLSLPHQAPDAHIDLPSSTAESDGDMAEVRVSGAAAGAQLQIGGRNLALAPERRAGLRPRSTV